MKATTPKGRVVVIEKGTLYGTSNQSWRLLYGGYPVAYWTGSGSGITTIEDALVAADDKIDACGLHE